MERYAEITQKRKREIVLLRGSGCRYGKCAFCDYHTDFSEDEEANFALNSAVLGQVSGRYGELEVINSGSVFELDARTLALIKTLCRQKRISVLHFESHYMYRNRIPELRKYFGGVELKIKLGLETFDTDMRERVMNKGMADFDESEAKRFFDEANLLFGISGQTARSMKEDIEKGLAVFGRLCVNVMCENSCAVKPDKAVIAEFMGEVYPEIICSDRIDVLIENTDFGVGD